MNLDQVSESIGVIEKQDWLASEHGLDSAFPGLIDGAALGAVYAAGLAKAGTLLALNTSTNRYVPYDQATSANGLNVPAGYLAKSLDIRNKAAGTGFINTMGAILDHCIVRKSKLPRSAAQTGGPHADAVAALKLIGHRA